jgi:hypothetical protein
VETVKYPYRLAGHLNGENRGTIIAMFIRINKKNAEA